MLTVPQLQPQKGDPAPSLRCHEIDPPSEEYPAGLAVFRCGNCGWWDTVEFHPEDDSPETVRGLVIEAHKRSGPCR